MVVLPPPCTVALVSVRCRGGVFDAAGLRFRPTSVASGAGGGGRRVGQPSDAGRVNVRSALRRQRPRVRLIAERRRDDLGVEAGCSRARAEQRGAVPLSLMLHKASVSGGHVVFKIALVLLVAQTLGIEIGLGVGRALWHLVHVQAELALDGQN